jgi:hypothetical protein
MKMILTLTMLALAVVGVQAEDDVTYYRYNHDGFWTYAHFSDHEVFATRDINDNITYKRFHYFADDVPAPTPVQAAVVNHQAHANTSFNHDGRAFQRYEQPVAPETPKVSHTEIIDGQVVTVLPN